MSQDREFETYIQGKSDLSRAYADLPKIEVPDHLDAAILAEAHRAVGARPGAGPKRRWMIPLSLVASFFAVVVIGLQLPHMLKDAALPQPPREELADARMADKKMAMPLPAPAVQTAAPQNAPGSGELLKPAPVVSNEPLPAPAMAPAPSVEAPAPRLHVAAKKRRASGREEAENQGVLSAEMKSAVRVEDYSAERAERAPAPASVAAAPRPAQAERMMIEPLKEAAGKEAAGGASASPEDWLARIWRLKQQGKLDEATKELAAFKKRYPDYRVPEALEIR